MDQDAANDLLEMDPDELVDTFAGKDGMSIRLSRIACLLNGEFKPWNPFSWLFPRTWRKSKVELSTTLGLIVDRGGVLVSIDDRNHEEMGLQTLIQCESPDIQYVWIVRKVRDIQIFFGKFFDIEPWDGWSSSMTIKAPSGTEKLTIYNVDTPRLLFGFIREVASISMGVLNTRKALREFESQASLQAQFEDRVWELRQKK